MNANAGTQTSAQLFGTGISVADGDLVMRDGDFVAIEGHENLYQCLRLMLETPFGSDLLNTNYGLDLVSVFTVPQALASSKEILRLNIIKSLSNDNRIDAVRDVAFDDEPEFTALAPELATNPNTVRITRSWHVVAACSLIDGTFQSIALRGPQT